MYSDNEKKFVAVLNRRIDASQLFNALGHMAAGIVSQTGVDAPRFLRYEDANGTPHPGISTYPFIVLKADNGNQIRTLRQRAIEAGLPYVDFVDAMLGTSAQDQLNQTKTRQETEFEYIGIVLFGSAVEINLLTRKFSLFAAPKSLAGQVGPTDGKL